MKKIFLIVAVLMLATPALAVDPNVDIWAEQGDDANKIEIWYEVTPATGDCNDGNRPRAFGLNITVTDGNIIAIGDYFFGECNDPCRGYGIFPGTISIAGGEVTDWGEPVAPGDDPGAEGTGLDTNTIVVEMGSLYTGANCPPDSDLLFTITVSMDCNVSIVGNAARTGTASPEGKGVVLENLAEVLVNFPEAPFKVHGVSRYVPDVVGWEQSAAETEIVDVCNLVVGDISWVCHSSIDYDHVVSTDPEAGTKVKKGSSVDLLKSLGLPHVPDVVNEPNLVAQATIEDVCGLSVGNITAECNDIIPAGNVISTNPAYCSYPDCGTAVDIVISTGSPTVPNVVGDANAAAQEAIDACDLVVGNITTECSCGGIIAEGNVIKTNPFAGAKAECGSAVDIVVSTGILCDCFPSTHDDYAMWLKAGCPECWCPDANGGSDYQCKGDADNAFVGKDKLGGRKWVTGNDYNILVPGWQKYDGPNGEVWSWICADFDHAFVGKDKNGSRKWVTGNDYNILVAGWQVYDNNDVFTTNPCFP